MKHEDKKNAVLLIDGDMIAYRAYHSLMKINISKQDDDERMNIALHNIMMELFAKSGIDNYMLFLTGKGNFRKYIFPKYKANRKPLEKPALLAIAREWMITTYNAVLVDGYEADDALLTWRNYFNRIKVYGGEHIEPVMTSADKDMLQIPGWHFNIHYKKMNFRYVNRAEANTLLAKQIVMGDSIDNIPGIKGCGPKTAEEIVQLDLLNSYGELYHPYDLSLMYYMFMQAPKGARDVKGMKQAYNNWNLNRKLVTLVDYHGQKSVETVPPPTIYKLSKFMKQDEPDNKNNAAMFKADYSSTFTE